MILVRVTTLDECTIRFAEQLRADSGADVAWVIDERQRVQPAPRFAKVGVSAGACAALGLYCPDDFAWRCGDYGYYLARKQFPAERFFWMVEYDVRFSNGSGRTLFETFADHEDIDFLATHLRRAERDWGWYRHATSRDLLPYRCLFPLTRLSAPAIDALLAKRIAHARQPLRRILWPNDESFVATTAMALGLRSADLNDFGTHFYDDDTFSFRNVLRGEALSAASGPFRIYHPVLFGEAYDRKVARDALTLRDEPYPDRLKKAVFGRLNRLLAW